VDLKNDGDRAHIQALAQSADVLIEQFRPGVMDRLELGYAALSRDNPGLIYCSITGYGQTGAKAHKAAHDLNYLAETGLLGLTRGADGAPVLPPVLAADIGGGAYPAVINVLLALQRRVITGLGCHLDVSMCDNLFTFGYWGLGAGMATGHWPQPGGELTTGGSPRYQIYRCADDQYLAAAPIEERFWQLFCDRIGLPSADRDDAINPETTRRQVAALIATRTARAWREVFDGVDACVSVVASLEEASRDPAFVDRGLFARQVTARDQRMPALPVPLASVLRNQSAERASPALGPRSGRAAWALDQRGACT
jgi:crotonobetainyl-CoA:carnitine CoA-transferase CaiB-like acyl-CoA transferase